MRRGREFWRRLAGEVDGGERIADVARRHRVQPRTLTWWRWKLRTERTADARLLPVVVSASELCTPPSGIELRIGDVVMRVAVGTDVRYCAALIHELRR